MSVTAHIAARLFDGRNFRDGAVLVLDGDRVAGLVDHPPADADIVRHGDATLAPGFVDLQVNGGGGLMFNQDPSVETLRLIARAHAGLGTTGLLPTLITDTPQITGAAIQAAIDAVAAGVPGILGLHLEGPHLARARKGAHAAELIRPMTESDVSALVAAAARLPVLKVTVAPESVTPAQIAALVQAGILVSLGHSDAEFDTCVAAAAAGACCVTHLFNAMSQLGSRAPGLAGAALSDGQLSAGLIADGVHVHPATMALALRAKRGPGRIFLVSDAMAPAGTDIDAFMLNDRQILRRNGRLTLSDGTLAGADLDMAAAVGRVAELGVEAAEALAMATSIPADLIGRADHCGYLAAGKRADFVSLSPAYEVRGTWRAGKALWT